SVTCGRGKLPDYRAIRSPRRTARTWRVCLGDDRVLLVSCRSGVADNGAVYHVDRATFGHSAAAVLGRHVTPELGLVGVRWRRSRDSRIVVVFVSRGRQRRLGRWSFRAGGATNAAARIRTTIPVCT